MTWKEVPSNKLKEPALTADDIAQALSKVKRSVGEEEVRKCEAWTRQYGIEGT
jgi:hypothetical protein